MYLIEGLGRIGSFHPYNYVHQGNKFSFLISHLPLYLLFQEGQWRPLMKVLLERFDVQVAINNIQGDLHARLSFPPYVVFEDVIKLADAIETMHKENITVTDKVNETSNKE